MNLKWTKRISLNQILIF